LKADKKRLLEDVQELEKQVIEINQTAGELLQKKQQLEGHLEKLPRTIDEVAERVRRKLDLTRSSGVAVFDVAVSMLKDELNKETKP